MIKRARLTAVQLIPLRVLEERARRISDELDQAQGAVLAGYAAQAGLDGVPVLRQDESGVWWLEEREAEEAEQ